MEGEEGDGEKNSFFNQGMEPLQTTEAVMRTNGNGSGKELVEQTLQQLRDGIEALASSEDWTRFLEVAARFHSYSFNNWMLILMQCPHARRVAGFRTWQSLGRQVQKGERAIRILAPSKRQYTRTVEKTDPKTGERTEEEQQREYLTFRAVPVFDVSQTEGEDLPSVTKTLVGDEASDAIAVDLFGKLEDMANSIGFSVTVEHVPGSANGFMNPAEKRIAVDEDLPSLHKAKTLAHEVAHAVLHSDLELDHSLTSVIEVEAESVAFCVMSAFGLDSSACSFGYVASWSKGDPDKVAEAGRNIHRGVKAIMDAVEEPAQAAA